LKQIPKREYTAEFEELAVKRVKSGQTAGTVGQHPQYCFTYLGQPIKWELTNTGWHKALKRAGLTDLRFHDLRHSWASWHRQAGTSCDELKDLGGWKSRQMVDRYAKYSTEYLAIAAARIENGRGGNVVPLSRFRHAQDRAA